MKKKLAIVGAGEAALPIINKAKEMNINTIAFGCEDSICKNLVDIFIEKSIFDIDSLEFECKKYNVDGIIASSEITTESTAYLAKRLGLPGNRCEEGFFARNKFLMRKSVDDLKTIKQPKYYLYNGEEIKKFPVMVKAVDSCSKRGITLVNNISEFYDAIEKAKHLSSDNTVLIEEYLEGGREYSIECLADKNGMHVIQITEKITSGPPNFTEIAHHQPADITTECKQKIHVAVDLILDKLGIVCGMAHLEIKIIDGDLYFIEVGARAGGDHIADTLTILSTDYDYYRGAIHASLGILETPVVNNISCSGIIFHCEENKKFKNIFDKAKTAKWCVKDTTKNNDFKKVSGNAQAIESGYIIYNTDHKIGLQENLKSEIVNNRKDAYELIWNHYKEIGRKLTDAELDIGIKKFLEMSIFIALINNDKIIASLVLYCNNQESLEAYICNVHVLEYYRSNGLSKIILEKAIEVAVNNQFRTIKLHVDIDNNVAINLYKKYNFVDEKIIYTDSVRQIEMIKKLF